MIDVRSSDQRELSKLRRKLDKAERELSAARNQVESLRANKESLLLQLRKEKRLKLLLQQLHTHLSDFEKVASVIVEAATAFLDCESGSVMVPDAGNQLRIIAHTNLATCENSITFDKAVGFAGMAWETRQPVWAGDDAEAHPYFQKIPGQRTHFSSLASVPIKRSWSDEVIGVLNCHNKRDGEAMSADDVSNLQLLAACVCSALEYAPMLARESRLATYDVMTGLIRRDRIPDVVKERLTERRAKYVHCCLLDLDRFKTINDTFGHQKGDVAIKAVASKLEQLFAGDNNVLLCHWGGDEFCVMVFSDDRRAGRAAKDRIRRAVTSVQCADLPGVTLSATVGSCSMPIAEANYDSLVATADRSLYNCRKRERGGGDA